jgi:hypothetical protein
VLATHEFLIGESPVLKWSCLPADAPSIATVAVVDLSGDYVGGGTPTAELASPPAEQVYSRVVPFPAAGIYYATISLTFSGQVRKHRQVVVILPE